MKTVTSYLRLFFFIIVACILLIQVVSPNAPLEAFYDHVFWGIMGLLTLIAIAAEIVIEAIKTVMFNTLSPKAKKRFLEQKKIRTQKKYKWINKTYKNLTKTKPLKQEHEIIIDHDYDGIQELDNSLPPWWVYGFYITIIFAGVYLARFEVFGGPNQVQEYEAAIIQANKEIAAYKENAKDFVDASTVELLTDEADLEEGLAIYTQKCVVCHKKDGGGGIGPNFTDQYWILGGGIKNIFQTISEGGRDGKGMIAWKSELSPREIAQVSSYILGFQGTTPEVAKVQEGELWTNELN